MSWFVPNFSPGINKLDTGLANEGGYCDSNNVRFYQGRPQTNGGWVKHVPDTFPGRARGAKSWRTLEGISVLAWGTATALWAEIDGTRRDITPKLHETVLNNVFTTVSGTKAVTVYLDLHCLAPGDTVTFSNHQTTVGGLTIEGTYTVTSVEGLGRFTITHANNASSTVSTPSGGLVDFSAPLPPGLVDTAAGVPLRDWSIDLWGEYGLFNPSGYGIFEFQPETSYDELAFNGNFSAGSSGWATGTGWSISGGAANASSANGNLSQDVDGVLEGGRYYLVTFTVTLSAGSVKLRMNAGEPEAVIDVGLASSQISKAGTYSRVMLCPADPKDIVWAGNGFTGSIDNVSYKLMDRAYRIITAPARVDAMFVDPRGLVVALGCTQVDGNYSATALRCSDLGNNRAWVPDTNSLATEKVLRGGGGRLMQGVATREQNLVGGDEGMFSLVYQGIIGDAFAYNLLATGGGLPSRHAMAESNGFAFWIANTSKFFIFRGRGATSLGIPEEIPCPIREDVFDNLDWDQELKIHAGINSEFSEFWAFYPDTRDGDECSRVAVCAWTQGTDAGIPWWQHQIARTAWVPPGTFQKPIGFAPDGTIYEHETGYLADTTALAEFIETAPFDIGDGEFIMRLKRIIPDFKSTAGDIRIYVKTRFSPKGPMTTYGPYTAKQLSEFLDMRIKARQIALRFEGASAGAFWRQLALRLDVDPTGERR